MTDKETKKQSRKDRILDAAEAVFSEVGFDGARVDEIVKRANVNKALLYYYFDSKEKLLQAITNKYLQEALEMKDQVFEGVAFEQVSFEHMFDQMFDFLKTKQNIIRIITAESLKESSKDTSMFELLKPTYEDVFSRLDKMNVTSYDPLTVMLSTFFFGTMPVNTFIAFGDKWADYFGFDKELVEQRFLEIFKEMYIRSIMQSFQQDT